MIARPPSAFANQLPRLLVLALDVELLHAGLQRRAAKAKASRGAVRTRDFPVGFPQGLENPFSLGGFLQSRRPRGRRRRFGNFRKHNLKHPARAEDDGPLDHVLQLADVPRPPIVGEGFNSGGRNRLDGAAHPLGVFLREVADEQGDVFFSLAQRRNCQWKDMQPVLEIAAELALVDHLLELAVGGGDETDIHPNGAVAAEPLEFLLLDGAQQLGLQLQWYLTDFVQE